MQDLTLLLQLFALVRPDSTGFGISGASKRNLRASATRRG